MIENDTHYPNSIRYFDFCYQIAITYLLSPYHFKLSISYFFNDRQFLWDVIAWHKTASAESVSATESIFFTRRNNISLLSPKSADGQDRPNRSTTYIAFLVFRCKDSLSHSLKSPKVFSVKE